MKRSTFGIAAFAVAAACLVAQPARSATSVGVDIQIGDPYRGAALSFRSAPDVVVIPESRVYYVRDYNYDLYRYGSYWYFIDDGYWYRARSYRGPFIHIGMTSVPRSVRYVPVKYRRNWKHGPPAHAVAHGYYKDRDGRGHDRDYDRKGPYKDNDRGGKRGKGPKH